MDTRFLQKAAGNSMIPSREQWCCHGNSRMPRQYHPHQKIRCFFSRKLLRDDFEGPLFTNIANLTSSWICFDGVFFADSTHGIHHHCFTTIWGICFPPPTTSRRNSHDSTGRGRCWEVSPAMGLSKLHGVKPWWVTTWRCTWLLSENVGKEIFWDQLIEATAGWSWL